MRHTLPRLSGSLLFIAFLVPLAFGQSPTAGGSQMISQAATQMTTYDALQCRVRQRVRLFDRELNGHGRYQQARVGDDLRLRLELKLPIGDQPTHLQQINDGEYLWVRRAILEEQHLSVIDISRVRAAWAEQPEQHRRALALGGIAELLFGIHEHFEFQKPRPGKLGSEPVWILKGRWKKSESAGQGDLPQIPTHVLVVLSRDELLPLFPFRIEYYRDERHGEQTVRQTMMTLEFFEVGMLKKVDVRNFTYSAGEQDIVDETDAFLRRY